MKVRLIKKQTIVDYIGQNRSSKNYFDSWLYKIKYADWNTLNDIKSTYNSADLLGNGTNRIIFNVGGNNFRMICSYYIGKSNFHLYINWIGSHSEYDKLCSKNKQYTIDKY